MGRMMSTDGRPAIKVIGIGRMGTSAVTWLSKRPLLNVKYICIDLDENGPLTTKLVSLVGRSYESIMHTFEKLLCGTDLLFAIYDSHDAFVVSRSQMLAAVARSMGVLASALVLVPYQYKRKMSFEDTAYVTIFPISPLVNPRLYIMNVIRTIVKPITLDGLCGIDLADTATTFRNGQIGYCGCGRDKHEIGNAAVNAVNKVKKLCPNISVATGGLSHIETGRRSTLEGLELALAVIYSSIGGHCDFFWQHRCSQSLSAPVMVSLIAVYNSSSYAFF